MYSVSSGAKPPHLSLVHASTRSTTNNNATKNTMYTSYNLDQMPHHILRRLSAGNEEQPQA